MNTQAPTNNMLIRRSCAAALDYVLFIAVLMIYSFVVHGVPEWNGNLIGYIYQSLPGFLIIVATWFLYFPAVEGIFGFTAGKALFDLKVVREQRNAFPFAVSVKRHLMDPVDFFLFGLPAILTALSSKQRKRLGDIIADSQVVDSDYSSIIAPLPEAATTTSSVADNVIYGGFWRRLAANLVDALILFVPLGLLLLVTWMWFSVWLAILTQFIGFGASAFYTTYFHAKHGATPGKMLAGLVVRRLNFEPISWNEALKRSAIDYALFATNLIAHVFTVTTVPPESLVDVSIWDYSKVLQAHQSPLAAWGQSLYNLWFWGEVIVLLFNDKKRALHDFLAGTVVIVEESLAQERRSPVQDGAA